MISLEQDTEPADEDLVGTRIGCVLASSDVMEQYGVVDKEETEKTASSAFKLVLPKEG